MDDLAGKFRMVYAGGSLLGCLLELLAFAAVTCPRSVAAARRRFGSLAAELGFPTWTRPR